MFIVVFFLATILSLASIETGQLIVVSSKNIKTAYAKLQRYEKIEDVWHKKGSSINVRIGRNGLGWGIGLHKPKKGVQKREGDGKSPSGIFELLWGFGYSNFNISFPYNIYSREDNCIDDINSPFYNKIINKTKTPHNAKSFEYMKLNNSYYSYGIVVNHNGLKGTPKKGAGSCIFIHIKPTPTSGCIAMKKEEIKTILKWLNPNKNPLLIQATEDKIPLLFKEIDNNFQDVWSIF